MSNDNYNDICFIVTSWEQNLFMSVKQTLLTFGVREQNIIKVSDRVSRPKSLNKAWNSATGYKYIVFIDEDVVIRDSHVFSRFKEILESPENDAVAGVLANPKLFSEGQALFDITHDKDPSTPWKESVEECTSNLISLNCALFRADLMQRFNEDMFGNQVFDTCFGYELAFCNKKVLLDKATLVLARSNDYFSKSLSYHTIVARNWHILKSKWISRNNWNGVFDFNLKNNNEIPSIEEVTHWNEIKQMQYCFAYNQDGLVRCYLNPRFSGLIQAGSFVNIIENSLKNISNKVQFSIPYQGSTPIFNI